jgi:hypothetical protein
MQGFRRVGTTTSTTNAAVWGENRSGAGGIGVVGASDSFRGVYAFDGVFGIAHNLNGAAVSGHDPGGLAGFFDGNVTVRGHIVLTGADCAEQSLLRPAARPPRRERSWW